MGSLTVEDTLAIQQLYARYNHAIDSGKGEAWAATFTADGTFSSTAGNFAGTEQLAGFGTAFAQRLKARHWINNLVIDASEGGASGSCYLMLLRLGDGTNPTSILTTAIYRDSLVKSGGEWKFSARTVHGDA
jgi:SnoaL-like domain